MTTVKNIISINISKYFLIVLLYLALSIITETLLLRKNYFLDSGKKFNFINIE